MCMGLFLKSSWASYLYCRLWQNPSRFRMILELHQFAVGEFCTHLEISLKRLLLNDLFSLS